MSPIAPPAIDFDHFSIRRVWLLCRRDMLALNIRVLIFLLLAVILAPFYLVPSFFFSWLFLSFFFILLNDVEGGYLFVNTNHVLIPAKLMEKFTVNILYITILIPLLPYISLVILSSVFERGLFWAIIFSVDVNIFFLTYWLVTALLVILLTIVKPKYWLLLILLAPLFILLAPFLMVATFNSIQETETPLTFRSYLMLFFLGTVILWVINFFLVRRYYEKRHY